MSANACSIKGGVKEHFSPCTGGADIFRDIQPLTMEDACLVSCRGLCSSISASSCGLRQRGTVPETEQALWLYGVNHGSI